MSPGRSQVIRVQERESYIRCLMRRAVIAGQSGDQIPPGYQLIEIRNVYLSEMHSNQQTKRGGTFETLDNSAATTSGYPLLGTRSIACSQHPSIALVMAAACRSYRFLPP